jgi:hypothetical protein
MRREEKKNVLLNTLREKSNFCRPGIKIFAFLQAAGQSCMLLSVFFHQATVPKQSQNYSKVTLVMYLSTDTNYVKIGRWEPGVLGFWGEKGKTTK